MSRTLQSILACALLFSRSFGAVALAPGMILVGETATNTSARLTQNQIALLKTSLDRTANLSWEIGTHTIALMEFDYPDLAVFSTDAFPPPANPYPSSVNVLASRTVDNKPADIAPLMRDGSAGDPASIGIAVLVANATVIARNKTRYSQAAQSQLQYLLASTPRTSDGAISHRADKVQLWSDFVYMAPPFLAYYGVLTGNATLMQAGYDQCRLYRNYLRAPNGLWRHIALGGAGEDPGLWATGNAWAAAGMLRVMATLLHSDYADRYRSQIADLASWTTEIVEASFAFQRTSDALFPNYFNGTGSGFPDAASVALMAGVSYRLAQLGLGNSTVPKAEIARQRLYTNLDPLNGYLTPVVDPLSYTVMAAPGVASPEGQAFMLLMEAGWRDWIAEGGPNIRETSPARALPPTPVGGGSQNAAAAIAGGSGLKSWISLGVAAFLVSFVL